MNTQSYDYARFTGIFDALCRSAVSVLKFSAAQENEQVIKDHVGDRDFHFCYGFIRSIGLSN